MNNTLTFIIMALIAGSISGLVYAGLNLAIVEPYTDKAIELEIENLRTEGETIDINEVNAYRLWQKEGSILAAIVLSIGIASIFTLVYAYARKGLKGSEVKRGLVLASILWIVLFLVPFIKYPANPPAVGDPESIYYRQALYISIIGISASTALALAYINKSFNIKHKFILPLAYIAVIAITYVILPNNPDEIAIPANILNSFRATSIIASLITWLVLGITFGALYEKFKKRAERTA